MSPRRRSCRACASSWRRSTSSCRRRATLKPGTSTGVLAQRQDAARRRSRQRGGAARRRAQAEYDDPSNIGHFGLNLRRYAHFTSPIRRYADLLVHRALVRALGLGAGGLADEEIAAAAATSRKQISDAERRAMAAERETTDRLIAAHLADASAPSSQARIAGVTRVRPVRAPEGHRRRRLRARRHASATTTSVIVEDAHALVGDRTGEAYRLGDTVEVRLVEAIPTAGALRFEMLTPGKKGELGRLKGLMSRRPKPRRYGPPRRR